MVRKERRQYLTPEIPTGIAAEIDGTKPAAAAAPTAVVPWTHYKIYLIVPIILFERLIQYQRSVHIFLIPPSADDQRRDACIRHIKIRGARLPVRVPGWVFEKRFPRM